MTQTTNPFGGIDPEISGMQTTCNMTENGLTVVLRTPAELQLAARWSMNGAGITFKLALEVAKP